MKVLILNHSDKFGGAANSTIRIFKSLQKKKGLKIYLYVKKKISLIVRLLNKIDLFI
jgi:hypothetical protein